MPKTDDISGKYPLEQPKDIIRHAAGRTVPCWLFRPHSVTAYTPTKFESWLATGRIPMYSDAAFKEMDGYEMTGFVLSDVYGIADLVNYIVKASGLGRRVMYLKRTLNRSGPRYSHFQIMCWAVVELPDESEELRPNQSIVMPLARLTQDLIVLEATNIIINAIAHTASIRKFKWVVLEVMFMDGNAPMTPEMQRRLQEIREQRMSKR